VRRAGSVPLGRPAGALSLAAALLEQRELLAGALRPCTSTASLPRRHGLSVMHEMIHSIDFADFLRRN
jgi:hypothetical protein